MSSVLFRLTVDIVGLLTPRLLFPVKHHLNTDLYWWPVFDGVLIILTGDRPLCSFMTF